MAGYNYAEKCYPDHHKEHPDWVIYGSETASLVHSRGVYKFPYSQSMLSDEDEQCSALGNSNTSWGAKSIEDCITIDRDTEFSFGQFLWTGFDYIGEPTPYHTKNSYFGQLDTAGFPKDSYYLYKSVWTDSEKEPFIHILPYWDFNIGDDIDVYTYSNAEDVELFFNGTSLGKQHIDLKHGDVHIGLHCSKCNSWIKWVSKNEISILEKDEYKMADTVDSIRNSVFSGYCGLCYIHLV